MLYKAHRDWWVAPGGKRETSESIVDTCIREYQEETGLTVVDLHLACIFTVVVQSDQQVVEEWMLYTFVCREASGELLTESDEGMLAWQHTNEVFSLPMAEGDKVILNHVLNGSGILVGTFFYTEDYQLLDMRYQVMEV